MLVGDILYVTYGIDVRNFGWYHIENEESAISSRIKTDSSVHQSRLTG